MVILENIDIDIDIDKAILQNIDIDKISNRFKFGISNRAMLHAFLTLLSLGTSMILTSTHRSENSDLKRSQHTLIQMYQF